MHHRRAVVVAGEVRVVRAECHVGDDAGGDARRQRRHQVQHLAKRLAVDEFHDPGQPLGQRRQPEDGDNVRMVQLRGAAGVPPKLAGTFLVLAEVGRCPHQNHRPPRSIGGVFNAEHGRRTGAGQRGPTGLHVCGWASSPERMLLRSAHPSQKRNPRG